MDAEVDLSVVVVYYEIARKSKLLGRAMEDGAARRAWRSGTSYRVNA
jgi:hypothetical protein